MPQAREWLTGALCHLGAGAKTNAGYGAFRLCESEPPPLSGQARAAWNTTLELVTPAFLAGAGQTAEDCELRPASLRGLLRWWWRTLHAGFVDVATLRAMEAAIWGSAEAGGAVQIVVEPAPPVQPSLYQFKDRSDPVALFKREHDLQSRPNQKTTQGLFYASYGMDETSKGRRRSRWFMPELTSWSLRLTARSARYLHEREENNPIEIPADIVLDQAKAALSLLCRFGGVGSKARKGFGSFKDINGLSIEECRQKAQHFRSQCGLGGGIPRQAQMIETPSFDHMLAPLEIETPWRDPWFALDQLGYAAQSFAQKYKHKEEKTALGLPRKIHRQTPKWLGADHQKRDEKTPPDKFRNAAPVHYHLARSSGGALTIRIAAFPSPYLPNHEASRRILGELLDHLRADLGARVERFGNKGQRLSKPPTTSETSSSARPAPPPNRGDRIAAVLLEEKTSKGGWKAKDEATGWAGYIHNTADVPSDVGAGQRVELIVDIGKERDFRLLWPTPDVAERARKSLAPHKKNPRRRR